jgi:hypothetical protein
MVSYPDKKEDVGFTLQNDHSQKVVYSIQQHHSRNVGRNVTHHHRPGWRYHSRTLSARWQNTSTGVIQGLGSDLTVFARMVKSQFKESLSNSKSTPANPLLIPLPDEDEEAFTILCSVIHYQMDSYSCLSYKRHCSLSRAMAWTILQSKIPTSISSWLMF